MDNEIYGKMITWIGCDIEIEGNMELIDGSFPGADTNEEAISAMEEVLNHKMEELTERHCTSEREEGEYRFAVDVEKKMVMIGKADLRGSDGWIVLKIGKFKIEEV